ncbi:MAG: alkaline phosphatase [Bacillota bacterium]
MWGHNLRAVRTAARGRGPIGRACATHSPNYHMADSAAAGTALSTGHKTDNGTVGIRRDGTPLKTLTEAAMAAGKAAGIISSNTV